MKYHVQALVDALLEDGEALLFGGTLVPAYTPRMRHETSATLNVELSPVFHSGSVAEACETWIEAQERADNENGEALWGVYVAGADGLHYHLWDFETRGEALGRIRDVFGGVTADKFNL